jgi:integrase/recombinase XerD
MGNELVRASEAKKVAASDQQASTLPALVERAGVAGRFAWEEYFYAEHHNPHTQAAYLRAVKRFLAWAEGKGVELVAITPGMVGQYIVGLGGSAAKRNLHLSALRGFFDRLVNRHVVILNPAASVKGVKEKVMEGKTPEISIDQARALLASVDTATLIGKRDKAILATLAYTACRAGAVAKLRLGDFQADGTQYVLRFQEKGGKSREIPVRHDLQGFIVEYLEAAGISEEAKDRPLYRTGNGKSKVLTGNTMDSVTVCELVKRRLKDAGLPSRLSPHSFRGGGDHRPVDARGADGRWPAILPPLTILSGLSLGCFADNASARATSFFTKPNRRQCLPLSRVKGDRVGWGDTVRPNGRPYRRKHQHQVGRNAGISRSSRP